MNNSTARIRPTPVYDAHSQYRSNLDHEPTLAEIVAEIKQEVGAFVNTRIRIMKAELQESVDALKIGVPLAVLALGLVIIASLLFTAAAVTLVASAFAGNPYAWFFGFIIIGVLWVVLAGVAGLLAMTQFRNRFPKRTVEVLKADKIWLQQETRQQS